MKRIRNFGIPVVMGQIDNAGKLARILDDLVIKEEARKHGNSSI